MKAEIRCPKLVPVFTICPCRSVNHYQNGSSQTERARSKAIDCQQFCVKLFDTACVGEERSENSASEDSGNSAPSQHSGAMPSLIETSHGSG